MASSRFGRKVSSPGSRSTDNILHHWALAVGSSMRCWVDASPSIRFDAYLMKWQCSSSESGSMSRNKITFESKSARPASRHTTRQNDHQLNYLRECEKDVLSPTVGQRIASSSRDDCNSLVTIDEFHRFNGDHAEPGRPVSAAHRRHRATCRLIEARAGLNKRMTQRAPVTQEIGACRVDRNINIREYASAIEIYSD